MNGKNSYYSKNSKGHVCTKCKLGYHGSCQGWLCICTNCVDTIDKQVAKIRKILKLHSPYYKHSKDNPGGIDYGPRGQGGKYGDETSPSYNRASYNTLSDSVNRKGYIRSDKIGRTDWDILKVELKIDREARKRGALDIDQINWDIYDRTGKIVRKRTDRSNIVGPDGHIHAQNEYLKVDEAAISDELGDSEPFKHSK